MTSSAETTTDFDIRRRYLVPVGRLPLPDEPDLVHLSVYQWLPHWEEWATGIALCGRSAQQGALPPDSAVTCEGCEAYRPTYEAALEAQNCAVEAGERLRAQRVHEADTPENGAWHTVWLEGSWRWVTSRMTTEQREYAADRVAAYSKVLDACDGLQREEPEGLRWWREASR